MDAYLLSEIWPKLLEFDEYIFGHETLQEHFVFRDRKQNKKKHLHINHFTHCASSFARFIISIGKGLSMDVL